MRLLLLASALLFVITATTAAAAQAPAPGRQLLSTREGREAPAASDAGRSSALDVALELSRRDPPPLPPDGAEPQQSTDGVAVLVGADRWHEAGFSGHGVRVAVIDPGFGDHEEALADLGEPVRGQSFRADGSLGQSSRHGLRAARIVRELAPRAELLLLAFSSTSELADAVEYAIEEGVDVISFSVGFVHNGPGDGSGRVNAIVDRATEAGVLWTTAAGNWAEQHWSGLFSDGDGDGVHEFGPERVLNGRVFRAGDLISVSLRWDDEWGAACSDYDLELFGPDGSLVQASRRIQDCYDDPIEGLSVLATVDGRYSARIVLAPGASEDPPDAAHTLSLLLLGSPDRGGSLDLFEQDGSLAQPADHPAAVAVGALDSSGEVARFSSRGPTADERTKPDLLAPVVLTSADGGRTLFGGTSAAAPLVAAVAALLIEAQPDISREALAADLLARARPPAAGDEDPTDAAPATVRLGGLEGLGPLLPPGGREAALSGVRDPESRFSLFTYGGPDGYPLRFLHLLLDGPQPLAIFHYDEDGERWLIHINGAPEWVNSLGEFDDGDEIWVRFD